MWLLIDDERNIYCDIIARTSHAGKEILRGLASVLTHLVLDHDLGPNSDESGYEVAKWAFENACMPENVQVVTMNPVGREKIVKLLESNGYFQDGATYKRKK